MDSETDFSSDSDYDEFAYEILFVGDILQPFQFKSVFTAAEIQSIKDLGKAAVPIALNVHVTHSDLI